MPQDALELLSPGQRLRYLWHKYEVEEALSRGGFGATFRASRVKDGAPVLIKQMLDQEAEAGTKADLLRSFQREARFLRRVKHPAFPHGYHYFQRQGCFYVVMEFINGKNVARCVEEFRESAGIVPDGLLLYLGQNIAEALKVVHGKGFVYRDLKPENVMVDGKSNRIRLIDFGTLYKKTDREFLVFETEGYTPPEFLEASTRLTPAGDLYSLGALLFELATGNLPAPDQTLDDRRRDKRIRDIVNKCLRRDPAERFPSARAVLKAFRAITDGGKRGGEPIKPIELKVIPKTLAPATCTFCGKCGYHDPESTSGICPKCGIVLRVGRLTWTGLDNMRAECFLFATQTFIGSGNDADVSLGYLPGADVLASRHARIFRRQGTLYLLPLDIERADTRVGDRRILGAVELLEGDEIKVGPVALRFHVQDAC
ncbi:MAG: FHA domain-containing serine/threonine-protein kinase [Acidobacteriota bacterium]